MLTSNNFLLIKNSQVENQLCTQLQSQSLGSKLLTPFHFFCQAFSKLLFIPLKNCKNVIPLMVFFLIGISPLSEMKATEEGMAPSSTFFITTWETTTVNEMITIPTSGLGYNYSVDWGDGNTSSNQTGDASHTYTTAGIHTIKISGDFPRIIFNDTGDKLKIKSIEQWGNIAWLTMKFAFKGAANLVYNATDAPDLSNVVNMEEMFLGATNFNGDLSNWDVSNITNMKGLFKSANSFNGNITNWDVSNVTDMSYMFNPATNFNQNLNWDVSKVTNMSYMFAGATSFNGNISNWNVSNVTNMNSMFSNASSFNQPLNWTVTNVTKMKEMFANATSFNQPLNWDVSNVTNMSNMFEKANSFNQNLAGWNIANVTTMKWMLYQAGLSNVNYDNTLIGWATQTVQPGVLLYSHTLKYCNGETARNTLTAAPNNWIITGDVKDCPSPFITTWETTTDWESITIPTYGTGYDYLVDWGDGSGDFGVNGNATHFYATAGTYTVTIYGNFPRIYFNNTGDKDKIKSIEQWGTNKWSQMGNAFYGCSNLVYNATDAPNLSMVTSMHAMFRNATSFNGDLSSWDVSNITIMNNTFQGATSFNGNISNWNVEKVTNMQNTFARASSFNQDLSSWDVAKVERMDYMFRDATSFNSSLANWDVSKCSRFVYMFRNATSFNQDLSSWTLPTTMNVNMQGMFRHAISFDQNLGSWDISRVTNMVFFLSSSGLSKENYDNTLIGWAAQSVQPNVTLYSHTLKYCDGETAWHTLTSAPNNWNIIGDTKDCPSPFITTWETTNPNQLIGFNAPAGAVFTVDWGDGNISSNVSGPQTHSYTTANTYTVKISGDLQHFISSPTYAPLLKSIEQWGNIAWTSMDNAFEKCSNMIYNATDAPILSNVTSMTWMFDGASNFNGDLSNWDVSMVTNMTGMFQETGFNGNISNWDVSSVTNMSTMFASTTSFNGDLSNWDVSNVTTMRVVFSGASSFNGNISGWDVSKVIDMYGMFRNATSFNQPLNWDVSKVLDMSYMFEGASSFNQSLGNWNISSMDRMDEMLSFSGLSQTTYDQTLFGWANQSNIPFDITLGASGLYHCDVLSVSILTGRNWTIQDFGQSSNCSQPLQENTSNLSMNTPVENETTPITMNLYPNPATDFVNIELNRTNQKDARILLYDHLGKVMLEKIIATDYSSLNLNLSDYRLQNGIYNVTLFAEDGIVTRRLVISKN